MTTLPADEAMKKAARAMSSMNSIWPGTQTHVDRVNTERLIAAIRALNDVGYEVLPREPTREMWAASGNAVVNGKLGRVHHDKVSQAVWDAMLAAAPKLDTMEMG